MTRKFKANNNLHDRKDNEKYILIIRAQFFCVHRLTSNNSLKPINLNSIYFQMRDVFNTGSRCIAKAVNSDIDRREMSEIIPRWMLHFPISLMNTMKPALLFSNSLWSLFPKDDKYSSDYKQTPKVTDGSIRQTMCQ